MTNVFQDSVPIPKYSLVACGVSFDPLGARVFLFFGVSEDTRRESFQRDFPSSDFGAERVPVAASLA